MSFRGTVALVVLLGWVLLGPIAMAFDACGTMAAMCEGPCGVLACAVAPPTISIAPTPVSSVPLAAAPRLPASTLAGLEHPPRSLLLSA